MGDERVSVSIASRCRSSSAGCREEAEAVANRTEKRAIEMGIPRLNGKGLPYP
jgi:hypothetical protein